jgi:hypothetical protein
MGKKKRFEDARLVAHGRQSDWSTDQPLFALKPSSITHLSEFVRRRQGKDPSISQRDVWDKNGRSVQGNFSWIFWWLSVSIRKVTLWSSCMKEEKECWIFIQQLLHWKARKKKFEQIFIQWEGAEFKTKILQWTQMEIEMFQSSKSVELSAEFSDFSFPLNWIDLFMIIRRKSDEVRWDWE